LFDYDDINDLPHEIEITQLSPYLRDEKTIFIERRKQPICKDIPEMFFGNMPNDGGHLLITDEEKELYVKKYPHLLLWIRPYISAKEFLHNIKRWCFWIADAPNSVIIKNPILNKRTDEVYKHRKNSVSKATRDAASPASKFFGITQPDCDYLLIPRVSSENREYIPMAFFDKNSIVADSCLHIPGATLYHFGILTSKMHNVWVQYVCGRLGNQIRYSVDIVYNNYPFPKNITNKQIKHIEALAQKILDTRKKYPNDSLAEMYRYKLMKNDLMKAHMALDDAVDKLYREKPFGTDEERIAFLFDLYEQYTEELFKTEEPIKPKKKKKKIIEM
jgi:hypothetical protein